MPSSADCRSGSPTPRTLPTIRRDPYTLRGSRDSHPPRGPAEKPEPGGHPSPTLCRSRAESVGSLKQIRRGHEPQSRITSGKLLELVGKAGAAEQPVRQLPAPFVTQPVSPSGLEILQIRNAHGLPPPSSFTDQNVAPGAVDSDDIDLGLLRPPGSDLFRPERQRLVCCHEVDVLSSQLFPGVTDKAIPGRAQNFLDQALSFFELDPTGVGKNPAPPEPEIGIGKEPTPPTPF